MAGRFARSARRILKRTGVKATIRGDAIAIESSAAIRHVTDTFLMAEAGIESLIRVSVLVDDIDPDLFVSAEVPEGEDAPAGIYSRLKQIEGDGTIAVFACSFSKAEAGILLVESLIGGLLIEAGSGRLALE